MSDKVETRVLNEGSEAAKSDPAYIILSKVVGDNEGLALHYFGQCPQKLLKPMVGVAREEGFDLMFEFNEAPDFDRISELAPQGAISSMDSMVQLWVLNAEKAGVG